MAATWPAVTSFRSAFISLGAPGYGEAAAGDHLQTLYRFWLVGHQLERGAAPWRDPYSFQPLVDPQFALGGWPYGLPFWPLEAAFGPVVAWNALLLGGIVAAGLLTYGWLRALSLPDAAAAAGGLAFAIAPYRLAQSGEHLLGWIAVLLPLALLAIERSRSAEASRASHAWGALAAGALVSIPLSGQVHLALGAIPFVVAYAAVRFRTRAFSWAFAGALAAAGVGLAVRYTLIAGSIEVEGRSLEEVELFQAGWLDLLDRWKLSSGEQFADEKLVYIGWLTPVLALAGLVVLARRRRGLALLLGISAIVPLLLAVGTHFPLYSPLWHALPPLRFPRVPERLVPIADLALAALAAAAVAGLLGTVARRRAPAVAAAVLALVAADLTVQPFRASAADPGNGAYAVLRPSGRLLELPLFEPGIHFGSVYLYYGLQAPRERPGGYSTLTPPAAFDFFFALNRLSCGVWLPGDAGELRSLGVRSVAFHAGLYRQSQTPGAWFAWRALQQAGYRPVAADGRITLLAPGTGPEAPPPVAEPPRSKVVLCEGWKGRTMNERQAPFWLWGEGRLELRLSAPVPIEARLWVDGRAGRAFRVSGARTEAVQLRGRRWHIVMPEVPALLETKPPRGLRLEKLMLG